MKKAYKIALYALLGLTLIAVCPMLYIRYALPDIALLPDVKIASDSARVKRGQYLAHHVAVCMDCHSNRDWSTFSGPMASGNLGGGGQKFGREMGFPGEFYAPNITPYALKDWTDAELFRAITSGVRKDGTAMFPLMPYLNYGRMDKEDIYDIIAYIRTLAPVATKVPWSSPDFPVSLLINTMPVEAALSTRPFSDEKIARGKYLINMAGCADCHSKVDKGKIIEGSEFGGGRPFQQPGGIICTPNITSDPETGIGNWSAETFVRTFKKYADTAYRLARLSPAELNSPMPWTMYAGMSDRDLEDMYDYLNSLKPIVNKVTRYQKKNK